MEREKNPLLEINHLSITFGQYEKGFKQVSLPVIRDLNITVRQRELVAVVGSSGSGKSLLAHAVMGILPYNATVGGTICFNGEPLTQKRILRLRGNKIVLVPQSVSYLDPLMKVGAQIRKGRKDEDSGQRMKQALARFGLSSEIQRYYPFELSGGMTRRVLISTAVVETPELIIADEPTPGLQLETAKRVLQHFRELADEGAGVLLITHDLELALEVADKVVVFYAGTTVEEASAFDFLQEDTLRHPYSKALFRAMPQHGFLPIAGTQPYVKNMPEGCPFAPRCSQAALECKGEIPYIEYKNGLVRCMAAVKQGGHL